MLSVFSIISGLLVGLLFGLALQRGRFCMNSAFRDPLLFKDFTLLKAVGLAIVVQLLGFYIISTLGIVELNPKPLYLLAIPLGSYMFGAGMVLTGGCASGTAYRVGEGMISSLIALFGFIMAAYLAKDGFLSDFVTRVQTLNKGPLTLSSISGIPAEFFVLIFAGIIFVLLFCGLKKKDSGISIQDNKLKQGNKINWTGKLFNMGWSWKLTGLAIGFIGILAFIFSSLSGRNYPLGITTGFETILKSILQRKNFLTWESFQVIGLVAGSFIGSKLGNEFKIRLPKAKVGLQSLAGGSLMGFGAIIAGGCNIGHILSGVPQLAISSILAGIFIISGGWTLAYFMFIKNN